MQTYRRAFTLVELLVVIAIIGVLVGLAAPSLQAMRESARRATCQSRLLPIGLAMQSYHDRWLQFPLGTVADTGPIDSTPKGNHHNWLGRIVDLLDQPVVASRIDRDRSIYDEVNRPVLELSFSGVQCPSASGRPANASDYAGLHHSTEKQIDDSDHGVFVLNAVITRDEVADGLSNTMFIAEKLAYVDDLGWLSGTRASLRNVGGGILGSVDVVSSPTSTTVGSIGSFHVAGLNVLYGSGEIRFLSDQIDQRVLIQMVHRSDGQIPLQLQTLDAQRRQSVQ